MDGLDSALAANGLSASVEPVADNPAMPNAPEGMSHWRVSLDGGIVPFSFLVSTLREDADGTAPTPGEAFDLLAADLRHPALESGPDDWLAAVAPEGDAPETWLSARRHLLDLLEDVRALPREIQSLIAGHEAAPVPGR